MRCGRLCKTCTKGVCREKPDASDPSTWIEDRENDDKVVEIKDCPKRIVPGWVWDAAALSDFAADGSWPVAGGTLDQSDGFIGFMRRLQALEHAARKPRDEQ